MTIWRGKDPLILASQSRARQMLLANAGISFEAVPADIDERAVQKNSGLSAPGEIAGLLAREKALFVSSKNPGRYVIGADQTLALGNRLFSKPAGRAQAAEQLRLLAGQTHELHSAVAVARDGKILFSDVVVARMTMRRLDESEIEAYLDQAGRGGHDQRRRLSARRAWRASVRTHRGRSFHHPRPAAVAVACVPARRGAARCLKCIDLETSDQ